MKLLLPGIHQILPVLFLLLTVLAVFGCEQSRQQDKASPPRRQPPPTERYQGTIVALGDSLTAGKGVDEEQAYPALLQNKLKKNGYNYRVINAGVSGETSSGTLARLNWILTLKPDIVILETGANDGLRGLPTSVIEGNLLRIIQTLKQKGVTVVLAGMQMVQNLGPDYTGAFARVFPSVARQEKVILIPFFLQGVGGDASLNQADTIHPTAAGYRIVVNTVYPYVVEAIGERNGKEKEKN